MPMNRGFESKNCVDVKMLYTEKRERKTPTVIIGMDKPLPIFPDASKTFAVSVPIVSFRSSSRRLKAGAATTISFFFLFFDISTTTMIVQVE